MLIVNDTGAKVDQERGRNCPVDVQAVSGRAVYIDARQQNRRGQLLCLE
jgi:hypothetical protein